MSTDLISLRRLNYTGWDSIQQDTSTYRAAVIKAFRVTADRPEPSCRIEDLDLETFKKAVAAFVAEIKAKLPQKVT